MDTHEFENKMKTLEKPEAGSIQPPKEIKLAILNARRSAWVSVWFIVLPLIFFLAMIMKHEFNIDLGILLIIANMITALDSSPQTKWLEIIILAGLPAIAVAMNALAITYFAYERISRSLLITIKLKPVNLAIIIISTGVLGILFLYLFVENCR